MIEILDKEEAGLNGVEQLLGELMMPVGMANKNELGVRGHEQRRVLTIWISLWRAAAVWQKRDAFYSCTRPTTSTWRLSFPLNKKFKSSCFPSFTGNAASWFYTLCLEMRGVTCVYLFHCAACFCPNRRTSCLSSAGTA